MRRSKGGLCIILLFLFLLSGLSLAQGRRVLMVIAPEGFRDEELQIPKGEFEKAGYEVVIASSTLGTARGMLGAKVKPQVLLKDVKVEDYDAVIFVGGVGAQYYFNHPEALRIAREAASQEKVLGAICLAPGILARAGVLKGKRATVWRSEAKTLKEKGAIYTGQQVEVDGKVITGNGPTAAPLFASKILEALGK
ncbi:MAG: DJ-1 family protein [Deltaproteobacteria bacterium]|nr:MAG: DJ-1 family protein [Deltaproteobacteria bacterium]